MRPARPLGEGGTVCLPGCMKQLILAPFCITGSACQSSCLICRQGQRRRRRTQCPGAGRRGLFGLPRETGRVAGALTGTCTWIAYKCEYLPSLGTTVVNGGRHHMVQGGFNLAPWDDDEAARRPSQGRDG